MSTLAKLETVGLTQEFIDGVLGYGPKNQDEFLELIDKNGLSGVPILKYTNKAANHFTKEGVYSFLNTIDGKLKAAANGGGSKPAESKVEEKVMSEVKKEEEVQLDPNWKPNEQQVELLKKLMAKEEERLAKRRVEAEKRIMMRVATGKATTRRGGKGGTRNSVPAGVPADKAVRYVELRNQIKAAKAVRKEQQAIMDAAKAEMLSIRPQPPKQSRGPRKPKATA